MTKLNWVRVRTEDRTAMARREDPAGSLDGWRPVRKSLHRKFWRDYVPLYRGDRSEAVTEEGE